MSQRSSVTAEVRVKKKPYAPTPEGNGEDDLEVSLEAWAQHGLRHDSVIRDLMGGQLRSRLCCPLCNRVSVTFDFTHTLQLAFPPPPPPPKRMAIVLLPRWTHREGLVLLERAIQIEVWVRTMVPEEGEHRSDEIVTSDDLQLELQRVCESNFLNEKSRVVAPAVSQVCIQLITLGDDYSDPEPLPPGIRMKWAPEVGWFWGDAQSPHVRHIMAEVWFEGGDEEVVERTEAEGNMEVVKPEDEVVTVYVLLVSPIVDR